MIAVIIPLYKQSQYLVEAVLSALHQKNCQTIIIIVNDGCPESKSDKLSRCLRDAHPKRVVYLKKCNGGLSSARNVGIKYVLQHYSEVKFFFFLDADNVVGENFFERGLRAFESDRSASWIYFPLRTFGFKRLNWKFAKKFNPYRQLFENQCDAGSIVRRELFQQGLFFNETLRSGYEDWEFFLKATRNGFFGVREDTAEFLYRTKRESMLTEAELKHARILSDIHVLHRDALTPKKLLVTEHRHCPRFLLVDVESGAWTTCSTPDRIVWREGVSNADEPSPPLLLYSTKAHLCALAEAQLLRPLLFVVQEAAASNFVGVTTLKRGASFKLGEEHSGDFILWGGESRALNNFSQSGKNIVNVLMQARRFTLETPSNFSEILEKSIPLDLIAKAATSLDLAIPRIHKLHKEKNIDEHQGAIDFFAWNKHVDRFETTYPVCANDNIAIAFFVPWLRLGGVDLCISNISKSLKLLNQNLRIHLVLTQENVAEISSTDCQLFDEIIALGHISWERRLKACDVIAASMDLAIIAHSAAAFDALRLRQSRPATLRFGRVVSYLHVIDQDKNGRLAGYVHEAAYRDSMLDAHIVISEQLRQFLINHGVSQERIRIAGNAPVVRPNSLPDAVSLAERKAVAQRTRARPLQVLFAGRLDYQKGLPRLLKVMSLAESWKLDVEFTVVGSAVLAAAHPPMEWPATRCRHLPATQDHALLQRYYSEADIFILLSRWEGVPLSILDAMAHGVVVIATDVGAISEVVTNLQNGYLIIDREDEHVALDAAKHLKIILEDESGCIAMRKNAVDTAFVRTWRQAAEAFLGMVNPEEG